MALSKLLQTVKSIKNETTYEDTFIDDYNKSVLDLQEDREIPTDRYRPSSLADGCKRMIYYHRTGLGANLQNKKDSTLAEICDNGTDRHERIQNAVKNIPGLIWLDVEEVVKEAQNRGINTKFLTWDSKRVEAKCHNSDLNINFLCDGIIRYKGKEVILEIKTIHQFGFTKLTAPLEKHIRQAVCYSISMGIDYVLFFYEDRNFLKKKAFLYHITEEDKLDIRNKLAYLEEAIANKVLPPKEIDKCLYCDRKEQCKRDGE